MDTRAIEIVRNEFPSRTPALPVEQPFGKFYVTVLPADILRTVAFSEEARVADASASGYRLSGVQRKQRTDRLAEIGRFIDTMEATFPTSIVLAANYNEQGDLEQGDARWRIEEEGGPTLVIPTDLKLASVVDGQHRLWAFNYANDSRGAMPLACSVFLDLPNPYQAYLFATVNFNQRKVDRSLAYELWGFDTEDEPPHAWTPEKTAVFLTRRLNMEPQSPLRGCIVVAAQDDEQLTGIDGDQSWAVSTATVVDGLLKLFSRSPMRDRTRMFMMPRDRRKRSDLPDDNTPARALYRQTNDKVIYELARAFLSAAKRLLWDRAGKRSYITRTVGLQAQFDILSALAKDAIESKTLEETFFEKKIQPAARIDFSSDFFQASGKGRTRLKNTLLYAMQLISKEQLPPDDREQYIEIVDGGSGQGI